MWRVDEGGEGWTLIGAPQGASFMLPAVLHVTPEEARRFHRRAVLLDRPGTDLAGALAHLGYVQIDPVNVCGRMHDLILRNRVAGYREGDLMRHLHGDGQSLAPAERRAFEHHLPSTSILVTFPLEAWPHLLSAMKARTRQSSGWSGRLTPRERELAVQILADLAARGPLSSDQIDDDRRAARYVWGSSTLAKSTLQKLFFHGRVLIARRENNRRLYDLPERVLPAATLALKEPTAAETARWLVLTKLRQRRLTVLKRAELPLVEDCVQPVQVDGCPVLFCLRDDLSLFERESGSRHGESEAVQPDPLLLAPLDPLIYDRRVTSALWGFDYTWEVYTPAHKRLRGHYSLPVLSGLELVGHVDPKADRANRQLQLVSRQLRRGHPVSAALKELAAFLSLRRR